MSHASRIGRYGLIACFTATVVLVLLAVGAAGTAFAAAPNWQLRVRWGDQSPRPASNMMFEIFVQNVGDGDSSGVVTVTDQLPAGFTRVPPKPGDPATIEGTGWSCSGTTTVTCVTGQSVPHRAVEGNDKDGMTAVFITASVPADASGTVSNVASVSGGGAPVAASETDTLTIGSAPTPFGIAPGTLAADVFDAQWPAGNPVRQAGSHPFELRVNFDFNLAFSEVPSGEDPLTTSPSRVLITPEDARTVLTILPRGLIGNPEATPKCTSAEFLHIAPGGGAYAASCPVATQVGTLDLDLSGEGVNAGGHGEPGGYGNFAVSFAKRIPVYNLVPPRGEPADFGFNFSGYVGHIYPTLDPAHGYAIEATTPAISSILDVRGARFTLWGVPADPAHDDLRAVPGTQSFGASSDAASIRPLVTLPMDCGVENGPFQMTAESWQNPGNWSPTQTTTPLNVNDCEDQRVRFEPQITMQPTTADAGAPTGLDVHLQVPQRNDEVENASELYAQNGAVSAIATPPIKKVVVTLPEGMTISTSAAQGLGNCSAEEIGLGTDSPVTCPANSRFGQLVIHTPLLPADEPMTGDIYIAKQNENPFHNFLAMYFVIHDESRGLLIKVPGRIDLDPVTGQITTTFDELPQFPISDMQLSFKGGVRSALVNPATCGTKTIIAAFYSWSSPETPVTRSSSYDVTQKPDGSPCVSALSERPFAPQLTAGTVSPSAGAYSQFLFRLTRSDEEQELSRLDITLPPGLSANIASVTKCSDAAIAQATEPQRTGAEELASPSCPASSQLGTVEVGSGVGVPLYYFAGKIYLAGPYEGAPLSAVVIVPAVAGPYDLGVTAVRSALFIDPHTSQIHVVTDPFPQIYKGIPVRIRDIRVMIDRPQTTFNPTSCDPMQVTGELTSSSGAAAGVASRFQAANCGGLAFKPSFRASTPGRATQRTGAGLTVKLTYPNAPEGTQANIAKVKVELPKQLPSQLTTLRKACTDAVFNANPAGCPAGSIVGHATAVTPILPVPLSGPAYFVSHGSAAFPDLVVVLQGYGITVDLVGSTFISKAGVTSSTFNSVPDVPVGSFELTLPKSPDSALTAIGNLCKSKLVMPTTFTAQNGVVLKQRTKITATGCPKHKARKTSKRQRAQRARHNRSANGRGQR